MGVHVSVLDPNPRTPVFSSCYCRTKYLWDLDRAPAEATLSYLTGIGRQSASPVILLPTTDSAALFVAAHSAELRPWFLFSELPLKLAQSLHSKKEMTQLADSLGIP